MDKGKAKVTKTYYTTEGTLYKGSIVQIENTNKPLTRIKDAVGRIYYVNPKDLVIL